MAAEEEKGVAYEFVGEAGGDVPFEPPGREEDIDRDKELDGQFDDEGLTGVAGAGNAAEIDVRQGGDKKGGCDDP